MPFQQQEMSILKELARSGSMTITDSHADSMLVTTTNSGGSGSGTTVLGHHPDDYSCLNGKVTTAEHLNHHLRYSIVFAIENKQNIGRGEYTGWAGNSSLQTWEMVQSPCAHPVL